MHALNKPLRASGLLLAALMLAAAPLAVAGDDEAGGYLGVYLQDLSPSLAKALQLGDEPGVLIQGVVEDSPAEEAGLEDGDVILVFAGETADDHKGLVKAVRKAEPGQKVEIVVLREGKKKTIEVELGEAEDHVWHMKLDGLDDLHLDLENLKDLKHKFKSWTTHGGDDVFVMGDGEFYFNSDRGHLGIHIESLSEQLGEYFGIEDGNGVLISHVVEDGAAETAGLKAGDIIIKLGDKDIDDTGDLHKALAKTEPEDKVELTVLRKGKTKDFNVTLGEAQENEITKIIRIHGGGDDKDIEIRAPRMIMRHGEHDFDFDDEKIVEIHRSFEHADGEMEELREEMEEMRSQLEELRKELQK